MKKEFILKILILFAFIQCTSQVSNSSKTDNNILTIEGNNIWIREYPSTGDVLFKLNNGSICKVLKKDKRETIRGNTDFWYKIEYKDQVGWVFGNQTSIKQDSIKLSGKVDKERVFLTLKDYDIRYEKGLNIKIIDKVIREGDESEVKIRARRWFTTHRGIANASRVYSCDGRFRRDANYSIDWERYEFALQDGWLNGATYNGPKKRGNWDLNLNSGEQEYYATIFSGAYFYYYGTRLGLTSPPTNATFKTQIKIAARKESGTSSHVHQRRFILGSQVYIKRYGSTSQKVFGVTIHELAHAAHWNLDRSSYNNLVFDGYISDAVINNEHPGDVRTLETWATTVEIELTNNRYRTKLSKPTYEYYGNFQTQTIAEENFYTTAGIDMIDTVNQRSLYGSTRPLDRVSGYTINQLEDGLRGAGSWTQWRDNIKARSFNPTENFVDELFNNWE